MVGRNYACPCGSGKKYKKCCGANALDESANIAGYPVCDKSQAYSGRIGKQREQFAVEYIDHKKSALSEIEKGLKERVRADNLTISCHKGCSYCCSNYPEASLQECEAIVYYLYYHEDILKTFLRNYPNWRMRVERLEEDYRRITDLTEQLQGSKENDYIKMQLDAAKEAFHQHQAPCPFLIDSACSIHEVRPWVCASIVSVTPCDWCNIESSDYGKVLQYTSDLWLSKEVKFFLPIEMELVAVPMPATVFSILREGYRAWLVIPGLENVMYP